MQKYSLSNDVYECYTGKKYTQTCFLEQQTYRPCYSDLCQKCDFFKIEKATPASLVGQE